MLGVNTSYNLLTELKILYGNNPIDPKLYKIIEKIENGN